MEDATALRLYLAGLDGRIDKQQLAEAQAFGLGLLAEVERWRASQRSVDVFAKIARGLAYASA